jgi:hypothetical protein
MRRENSHGFPHQVTHPFTITRLPDYQQYGLATANQPGSAKLRSRSKRYPNLSLKTSGRYEMRANESRLKVIERFFLRQVKYSKPQSHARVLLSSRSRALPARGARFLVYQLAVRCSSQLSLSAPNVWAKLQHMTMMRQAVEHGAPGCGIAEQFATQILNKLSRKMRDCRRLACSF